MPENKLFRYDNSENFSGVVALPPDCGFLNNFNKDVNKFLFPCFSVDFGGK